MKDFFRNIPKWIQIYDLKHDTSIKTVILTGVLSFVAGIIVAGFWV